MEKKIEKIKSIVSHLNSLFPESKAEEWDKVGLQYGELKNNVSSILVALDLTTEVFEKAIENKVDLIITHHPFLWEETLEENIKKAPYKKLLDNRLRNTGIGLYGIHTNYDQAKNGTAYRIAKILGFDKFYKSDGSRFAQVIEVNSNITKIENQFKEKFGITTIISNKDDSNEVYEKLAVLPGSGSIEDMISINKKDGVKLFATSDIKWSDWITIDELGFKVIEVTHGLETVFTEDIANILKNKFKNIDVHFEHSYEIGKL